MATLTQTHDGRVARLLLDRPPLNIIDLGYARELSSALESLAARSGAAMLLVEAKGKAFCAGVDVRDHLPDRGAEMLAAFHRFCVQLLECPLPVVAAVQGAALGGGCEITLCCDLVVADSHASFGQPEIRLGVFPPLASVALPLLVPSHVASELLLTGRVLGAEEARQVGLVNRVAESERFAECVDLLIGEILALSPASLRLAKEALALARRRPTAEEIAGAERFYVERLMPSRDALEGLNAFLEKRAPEWARS